MQHDPLSPARKRNLPPASGETIRVAVVVGMALFAIDQLDVVLAGKATWVTWLKAALTYLVPFLGANYGLLVGRSPARDTVADNIAPGVAVMPRFRGAARGRDRPGCLGWTARWPARRGPGPAAAAGRR